MSRIPISITKIVAFQNFGENKETLRYLFKIDENGEKWERTFVCDRESLIKFKSEIENLIDDTSTGEILQITSDQAKIVDDHYMTDPFCKGCEYKLKHLCITCLFELQSPLERRLYLELNKNYIKFQVQYGLNWKGENILTNGKSFNDPINNFKEVLTIADFYITRGNKRLCIYTDGHTFHEKSEDQVSHDKGIDRKLQELDYTVLRYTGKDVNENMGKIIEEIKEWIK